MTDIKTILWKEFRELFQARQGLFGRGGWISIAITVGLLGVLIPVQAGEGWVSNPLHMVWWVWVPFLMVTYIVTDTFAGERERHTLETLLASRLSDKTIFSLRSSTVRQAQQITGLIALIPILPLVLLDLLPDGTVNNLMTNIGQVDRSTAVLVSVGILAVINFILIALAMKRFQRAKLILD
jgi:ABC-2 type transport system permease protein